VSYKYHKLIGHYAQYLIPMHVGAVGYHYALKGTNILPRILSFGGKK
jgi:cytochrome b561